MTDGGTSRHDVAGSRSLSRALIVRIVSVGVAVLLVSLLVLGIQIQRTATKAARVQAEQRAVQLAGELSSLFERWRDQLLVGAANGAFTDWYRHPDRRVVLRGQIEGAMLRIHDVYPELIDEVCFIDRGGVELARTVSDQIAAAAELSPDESGAAFFEPTFRLAEGQVWQNEPYVSADSHRWVVSNSTPIVVDGATVALFHFEANLDAVRTLIAKAVGATMGARIVEERTGDLIADSGSTESIVSAPLRPAGSWTGAAGPIRARADVAVDANNGNAWRVEVSAPEPQPFSAGLLSGAGALVCLAVLFLVLVAARFAHGVSRPVRQVTELAEALARGDLTGRVEVHRRDEIGRMATALNLAVGDMAAQRAEAEAALAEREHQLWANYARLRLAEQQTRDRAQTTIDEISSGVLDDLKDVAGQMAAVRSGALTINEQLEAAGAVTNQVREQANEADQVVTALGGSLRMVAGIAKMISGVAAQTNQLALNATIEAVRAGVAGQGFGVVAAEVKELATTTSRSTAEITSTIRSLEADAQAVATTITGMADGVSGIGGATDAVRTVADRQRECVEQLNTAIGRAVDRINSMGNLSGQLERRSSPRVVLPGAELRLRIGDTEYPAELLDMSVSGLGCFVDRTVPLTDGTVGVALTLGGEPVSVQAKVIHRHQRADGQTAGLRLVDPPATAVALIRTHVENVMAVHG